MRRIKLLSIITLAMALAMTAGQAAMAATEAPFTQRAFAAAQHAGKPILVDIAASWCPTCAKQRPIINELTASPAFRDLVIYKVDFDTQKDVVRSLGARMQSTLIVFHGATERGRSVGDTNPASIRALLLKAN